MFLSACCGGQRESLSDSNAMDTSSEEEQISPVDARFPTDSDGIITDQETGLRWMLGRDQDVKWYVADHWVQEELNGEWRLPIRQELQQLFSAGISATSWGPFHNTGTRVWTSEIARSGGSNVVYEFDFTNGQVYDTNESRYVDRRVFLVSTSGPERFSIDSTGVICDSQTGLRWQVGPDSVTSWEIAQNWVEDLGEGWLLPTGDQLATLHNGGIIRTNMGLFSTSGYIVWTGDLLEQPGTYSYDVRVFDFRDGSTMRYDPETQGNASFSHTRVFAVF